MATQPIPAKIPPQLASWDDDTSLEVEIDQVTAKGTDFAASTRMSIDASRLDSVIMTGAILDKFDCTDVEFTKLEGAALRAYDANLLRVTMTDCRLTGAEFAEGHFEDCTFRNVKFDEAGFRFASFKRVRFENCMLRQVDFSNAKFAQVTFADCDLEEATFASASCANVDVTNQELVGARGILGLKGATISTEQLMLLAPLLASELGFHVKD